MPFLGPGPGPVYGAQEKPALGEQLPWDPADKDGTPPAMALTPAEMTFRVFSHLHFGQGGFSLELMDWIVSNTCPQSLHSNS